ncbi:MAG: family 78 glycoside hydrolase catalytic domain [Clostridia bacterium]|nr:family 78 glycoside hydrolase catalytic domain [Clostridia bacterium]
MNVLIPSHIFAGKWITNDEFCDLPPRNVYHRQLNKVKFDCSEHRNRHILFRRRFSCTAPIGKATLYITADDYYKLYVNGQLVTMGPAPAYHFQYNYNQLDITPYLTKGENVIAVHTLYQGLINRTWQSGDCRHGLLLDLEIDGQTVLCSDEGFLTAVHSAYREIGTVGYDTGFLEEYDSRAPEVGFECPDFDDRTWKPARVAGHADHTLVPQATEQLVFEKIAPVSRLNRENTVMLDFGSNYVGYLCAMVKGKSGDVITVHMGQELCDDGSVRHQLRANCTYEEKWILCNGESVLDQYDYKAFRYASLTLPEGCELLDVYLLARHYPFVLAAKMKPDYADDPDLKRIWALCANTLKYGVQEAVLDCVDREKGYYVGDGCYSALAHMILTGKDDMLAS